MIGRKCFTLFLVFCVVFCGLHTDIHAETKETSGVLTGDGTVETMPAETMPPQEALPPQGTLSPQETQGALSPSASETPSPKTSASPFILKNKDARLYQGGQKGIGYGKIKKRKLYHINSYASDEVKLLPSKSATFQVVGGIRKEDITSGKIKVTKDGVIKCEDRAKDKKQYAIVRVTAKDTKESIYVYVYFAPCIYSRDLSKQVLYQGKTKGLKYNYACKDIRFISSNPKVAGVNKKGVVIARKEGIAVISAQVKESEKNIFKTRIIVKEEPWLVDERDSLYSYEDMTADLKQIAWKYRGKASLRSLGTSEDGRNIWCLRIGNTSAGKKIVIDAGIHAREWMNPLMIVHKCEEILRQYADYKGTLNRVCLYVVPMINPDGITISQYGFDAIRSPELKKICKKTNSSARTWKGNARGVNLNFNFPGGWNKKNKSKKPDGNSYPGEKAASEKETKVMMSFINSLSGIRGALNYHSTGSILYWNYNVEGTPALYSRQSALAAKVNSFTHYRLMPKSISTDPNGGFGDWLIYNKKIPNVTVETGTVMCPLPHSQLKGITERNTKLLTWFVKEYAK